MAERNYLTIVSGLPRSGTSLTMQMISAGGMTPLVDNIRKADEDNPKGYYEFEPVKTTKKDASWIKDGTGKVVKMVHILLLDLPLDHEYRVVFTRRSLDEVIKSQNIMLDRSGKDKGATSKDRLEHIFRTQIAKVMKYMQDHPDHFKYVEVDYNEFIKDPKPQVEKVSAFLDGLDTDKMMAVVDPSLYRNRAAQ